MECPYATHNSYDKRKTLGGLSRVGQTEGESTHSTFFGPGMRGGPGTGCGDAEDAADDKLLTPLRNSNRFRHLSIVASSFSSTCRSLFRRFQPTRNPRPT